MNMESLLKWLGCILVLAFISACGTDTESEGPKINTPPNIIIVYTDDLGYGDLGCYGSVIHKTPNIDKLAKEGLMLSDFYAAAPVCTPSRASLLTGCYPQRVDMHVNEKSMDEFRAVLTPESPKGLNPNEITIADILKEQGYKTACIGKWHLGDQKPFFSTNYGFDYFYGILHSHNQGSPSCPLAIFEQDKVVSDTVEFAQLTKKMTAKAIEFIKNNRNEPFFIYLPHPMPHFPLAASEEFKGESIDGIYGDAIEEIDWSMGEIEKVLKEHGLQDNTLLVFTSDNGGETRKGMVKGGFNHPLKGHKGQTWEGGMRVPCIIKWPAKNIKGKVSDALTTQMDLLPTIAAIVDSKVPENHVIDGKNIMDIINNPDTSYSPTEVFFYYDREQLQAIRWGSWKLHLAQPNGRYMASWKTDTKPFPNHQLYDLDHDITETWNIADEHPEVIETMIGFADSIRKELGDYGMEGNAIRKAGYTDSVHCMTVQ